MLFLPLSKRMERKGVSRGFATFLCILILMGALAGIGTLLAWQISDLVKDASQIEQRFMQTLNQFRQYVSNNLGISPEQQKQILQKSQGSGSGGIQGAVAGIVGSLGGILVDTVLVLVYIFLFIYFRGHLKKVILKLVPENQKAKTEKLIQDSTKVAQQYLVGLAAMIVTLWIMYGIGFSIVGVKNAIFFAILCGLLEIVPFVGNITGTTLTVLFSLAQGGGGGMVVGIIITYAIVQFVQTYVLEPLVVGAEVNINPLFTILVIVAGELVWGIGGMILAIPLLGIVKIICDHVESLKPYGFMIGKERGKKRSGIADRIKSWFKK